MTPEHKVRAQTYTVKALINEEDEEIVEVLCHDCKAGQGGCKHALAFIFWLHRRSEEPSPTEVKCYWKKAKLSSVGDSVKFINSFELTKNMSRTCLGKVLNTEEFFNKAMLQFKKQDTINQVTKNFHRTADFSVISVHFSFIKFKTSGLQQTVEEFLCYLSKNMKSIECDKIQEVTTTQNESSLWHEMRYGRITASKLHEAAHCHTTKGSLVETILGGRKLIDTPALARGRKLEKLVIAVVEINLKTKIQKAGLFLNPDYPVFGASPDGLDEQNVYEVKCPSSKKTVTCYVKDGQPTLKVYAQLLLQMFFCKKIADIYVLLHQILKKQNMLKSSRLHGDN